MDQSLMEVRQMAIASAYAWRQMQIPAVNGGARDEYETRGVTPMPYAPAAFAAERRPLAAQATRLWHLETDLPAHLAALGDCLRGTAAPALTAAQKLSLLMKYSGAPLRWEPFNDYRLHRAIASPRSIFACEVYAVAHRDGVADRVYRYLPDYHALAVVEAARPSACAGLFAGSGIALVVVGHLDRLVRPYGELVPSLVGPEAGLLSAQLAVVARGLGWTSHTRTAFDGGRMSDALGIGHWSRMPLALMTLDAPELADLAPPSLVAQTIVEPRDEQGRAAQVASLRRLAELSRLDREGAAADTAARIATRRAAASVASCAAPAIDACAGSDRNDLLDIVRRRTSGPFMGGCAPADDGFDRSRLDSLAAIWAGLHAAQPDCDLKAVRVRPFVTVMRCTGATPGVYELDLAEGVLRLRHAGRLGPVLNKIGGPKINYEETNLAISLVADYGAELSALGPRGFLMTQQAVGEVAQQFALAAARHHLFSRMYKSFESRKVEDHLQVPGQAVLQIVAGHARRVNTAFELL